MDETTKTPAHREKSHKSGRRAPLYSFDDLPLSNSVKNALIELGGKKPVRSVELTLKILAQSNHSAKYAGGAFFGVIFDGSAILQLPEKWIREVYTLFDWEKIGKITHKKQQGILDGRWAIVGLGILDRELRHHLKAINAWEPLIDELEATMFDCLSDRGHRIHDISESVPVWQDDPVTDPAGDLLGRKPFARYLAKRIRSISGSFGAYAIHLYAPWGAGKSSLLNILQKELEKEDKAKGEEEWMVVNFNAWRHQHIQPPWWSLMDLVFKETKKRLSWWNRLREYAWRFNTGRIPLILASLAIMWIIICGVLFGLPKLLGQFFPNLASSDSTKSIQDLGQLIGLAATIFGGVLAFNRSMLFSSAQAAKKYTELTRDPMNKVKKNFTTLVNRVPKRIAIFIDDLDRCQSDYVTQLLEGMQTLFREAPVVFVVAADRCWINACYESEYNNIHPQIQEPGKSLGSLFLEKAFRFSIPIPGIPAKVKEDYWLHLINVKQAETEVEDLSKAKDWVKEILATAKTDEQILRILEENDASSFKKQQVMREEAVLHLATPEMTARIEHTLRPYADLLDPNPRAMKRLVNTYSANRALSILTNTDIDKHQLVLWTILSSKWPEFTEYLIRLAALGEENEWLDPSPGDEKWKEVWKNPVIVKVLRGGPKDEPLHPATLRICEQLRC